MRLLIRSFPFALDTSVMILDVLLTLLRAAIGLVKYFKELVFDREMDKGLGHLIASISTSESCLLAYACKGEKFLLNVQ